MSWNMVAKIAQEGFTENRMFMLTRANVGFTGTAHIALDDVVEFGDVTLRVISIVHKHEIPHGDRAPTTTVYVESDRVLSDEDEITLRQHGFK